MLDPTTISLLQRTFNKLSEDFKMKVLYLTPWSSHYRLFNELKSLSLSPHFKITLKKDNHDGIIIGSNFHIYGTPTGLLFNALMNLPFTEKPTLKCNSTGNIDVYITPNHMGSISQFVYSYKLAKICPKLSVSVYDLMHNPLSLQPIRFESVRVPSVVINKRIRLDGPMNVEELLSKINI